MHSPPPASPPNGGIAAQRNGPSGPSPATAPAPAAAPASSPRSAAAALSAPRRTARRQRPTVWPATLRSGHPGGPRSAPLARGRPMARPCGEDPGQPPGNHGGEVAGQMRSAHKHGRGLRTQCGQCMGGGRMIYSAKPRRSFFSDSSQLTWHKPPVFCALRMGAIWSNSSTSVKPSSRTAESNASEMAVQQTKVITKQRGGCFGYAPARHVPVFRGGGLSSTPVGVWLAETL